MKKFIIISATSMLAFMPINSFAQTTTESDPLKEECADVVDGQIVANDAQDGGVPCASENQSTLEIQAESDTKISDNDPTDDGAGDAKTSELEIQAESDVKIPDNDPKDDGIGDEAEATQN